MLCPAVLCHAVLASYQIARAEVACQLCGLFPSLPSYHLLLRSCFSATDVNRLIAVIVLLLIQNTETASK